jgi:quercetin dioxygenase-like cupin family protein
MRTTVPGAGALAVVLSLVVAGAHVAGVAPSTATERLQRALPAMDGQRLQARVFEVVYEGGGENPGHTHPCPVIGYVLEGAIRTRVGDGPERVLRVGESFYEGPGDRHLVSANASATERARFLATFVCDRTVDRLSIPLPKEMP